MQSDHHGLAPPIDSSAPTAPSTAPAMPMTLPNAFPPNSENPPASWITPSTIRTQPSVLRSSST